MTQTRFLECENRTMIPKKNSPVKLFNPYFFMLPRLLALDDHLPVTITLAYIGKEIGWKVTTITEPDKALSMLCNNDFDLFLTDFKMPYRDGLQVIEDLRQHHVRIPVIIMTGSPNEIDEKEVQRLGVLAVVSKPFDLDHLTRTLHQALSTGMDGYCDKKTEAFEK